MSGISITRPAQTATTPTTGVLRTSGAPFAPSRAARELGLKRREFDLAVHLGCVRTVPDEGGGGRRVDREEIHRLRDDEHFPETLRERVRAVGTADGAQLMDVTPTRFTRLARLGLVTPVTFYLNRYRAVVWLYLADELRQFALGKESAPLLTGRTSQSQRDQLAAGMDLRPRNWRGRQLGFLLRPADDPWARAAVVASFLDPAQVAEIVDDPYERVYVDRLRPEQPAHGVPGSPTAGLAERIMTADDPDEILWLRADLTVTLAEARDHRPAPRPASQQAPPAHEVPAQERARHVPPQQDCRPEMAGPSEGPERTRGLLGRLRGRNPRPARDRRPAARV
ncbi:DUF6397 family protein [Streptomyces turgidiscabies]|uniref:Uncharacterized protein n=1 Tax=Streptomyces turgidiscabies (strain Car8) TaxID=698760 RepID=L7EVH6_STRT8|nr:MULTISPECIES: DUF6397 family protein [Streptomyces]ELP62395.1 hypothetical protein STRTUCAR8_00940 [Streptomyces turgidiscabies Car8]MDX3494898.1 DUF6397 family protein [Streptomyces turgidiscabies]GAQ71514.1 hypothetical protein T45_03256 [Streptomyces turgidiscabies]